MLTTHRTGHRRPAVVLLHELGGSAATFRWVLAHLGDLDVVTVDLPGTNGSSTLGDDATLADIAAVLAQTLDAIEIPSAVVAGVAGGAAAAAALAAIRPDLAAGLLYSSLGDTLAPETVDYIQARVPVVREGGMASVVDPSLARSFPESLREDSPYDAYRDAYIASDVNGFICQQLALARSAADLPGYLAQATMPTVVLGGEMDELFPPEVVDRAASLVPNLVARVRLPGTAHLPHVQAPVAFAAAIRLVAGCVRP